MSLKLLRRFAWLVGIGGPLILFQQGCLVQYPDLVFRTGLQIINETLVFLLDNAAVSLL
jgi:hypothetical protein